MKRTVLVTGASAGIGRATAILLAEKGYNVYGAARRLERMDDLKTFGIKPLVLDLADDESMVSAVNHIIKEAGSISILINNAGFGSYGAIEDVNMNTARYQLDVNVMGAMRMAQLVLPKMRELGQGKIINISSVGGKVALPMGGWYHASKFALEALSDCMRMEVKSFGIDVIVVEPGATKSEWGNIAFESLMKVSGNTPYKDLASKVYNSFEKVAKNVSDPETIAQLILKAIASKRPDARYVGGKWDAKLLLALKTILTDKMMDKLIMGQAK
ncbi:short-subunit dehydrogenase [Algoriphagus sp. 4150]|uniref:oxidoreductase n=1 Tax=Algoriphagus sp. 4150 TaxID=2817756 RepID=UPI00285A3AE0|nr:oxidoreductase [Algoriphagus sp. 4150]MDR7131836.1 short-subunit dehydrogenase [Algoriphagus sp. 4150]